MAAPNPRTTPLVDERGFLRKEWQSAPPFATQNTLASGGGLSAGSPFTTGEIVLVGPGGALQSIGSRGDPNSVLHGSAAGVPTFSHVRLDNADVLGNLPVANLNSGLDASAASAWHGDATWKTVVHQVSITQPAAGLTVTGGPVTDAEPLTLALANDLAAVEGLASAGLATRTGADTWAVRSLVPPAAGMTIVNPAGTAGDPTFALADDLAAVEGLSSTGYAARTAANTWAVRTFTVSFGLSITNAAGVAGNTDLAVDQAMVPTMSGLWTFTANNPTIRLVAAQPVCEWEETDQAADRRIWQMLPANGTFVLRSLNDARSASRNALAFVRAAGSVEITGVIFGNTTSNPQVSFLGTGGVFIQADSTKLNLGASNDLTLYHDGTDSYVENITGALRLKCATDVFVDSGNLALQTVGKGLRVKEGTNGRQGLTAAMVAGTVTVACTSVTANSRIMLTRETAGGVLGNISYTKIAGTSFTINSDNALDTSTFVYQIFEPA